MLKDATAVNVTRWALYRRFEQSGLPPEVGTGGRTKYNRTRQGYPKAHWIDAACVGVSGEQVQYGFQTGDIVRAVVTSGKKIGTYTGRVAVRSSGSFDIATREVKVQGISYRYCTPLHKSDGYSYEKGEAASATAQRPCGTR